VRWPEGIHVVVASPATHLGTPESRKVLPPSVCRADAVFNLQRALLLVHAIERGDASELREALRDRWHQPFRAPLVPGFSDVLALEHPDLIGACLSGSGPSVLVLCSGDANEIATLVADVYARRGLRCDVRPLAVHQPGSHP
jgi:homoserine kinase